MQNQLRTYQGSCHCQNVKFQCQAPSQLTVWKCNCSVCWKKQNHHFIIPQSYFTLLCGQEYLKLYQFGTKLAKHYFCSDCGVESFYRPRSNPDGYGINIYCVDIPDDITIEYKIFDGQNWEAHMEKDSNIKKFSQISQ